MVAAGLTHGILEATSHGLAQQRVAACDFDIGVVTNITHEHLDYHGTYENYRAAKGRLFAWLSQSAEKKLHPPRVGVLNRDDSSYEYLREITKVAQVSYGLEKQAGVSAVQIAEDASGIAFRAQGSDIHGRLFDFPVRSHLAGRYNVSNCLAAVAVGMSVLGMEQGAVQAGIAALAGIPGRMERIELGQDFTAMVDFAHTPNALKRALEAARSMTSGRVIAVFGSAGLRDREKRRLMAEVSAEMADLTVLTAEDPRTESLVEILEEMAGAMLRRGGVEGRTFWRVPDRREALRFAVRLARAGDLVITCGKGHEQSMCFGETEYPWDDRTALRAGLAERLGVKGPAMPYLPEA
jgi:UDP-N-acetylmuramoyl-L-alanyl-D-glutamate--2,6-diaminopimelate ligase